MDTLKTLEKNISKAILENIFNYGKTTEMYIDKDDKYYYITIGASYILRIGLIEDFIFDTNCFTERNLIETMKKYEDARIGKEYNIIVTQEKNKNAFKLLSPYVDIDGIGIDKHYLKLLPKDCVLKLFVTDNSIILNVYDEYEKTLLGIICPCIFEHDEFFITKEKLITTAKKEKTADAEETA